MTLPHITHKQQDILLLLYRFRFLNRVQIQKLLHHKNPKNINTWLKDLTGKNYITRILDNQSKVNTTPAIYHVSLNGIKFLKKQSHCEQSYLKKLYTENKRSRDFIKRSLFIADIYVYLLEKYAQSPGFAFYTQSDFTVDGIIKEIYPLFVFRKGNEKQYYIVEMFSEKQPRYAIRLRIRKYITFFTNGDWLKNEQMPDILFISPNRSVEEYIHKFSYQVLQEESSNINIFVSTSEQVVEYGVESQIWKKVE